MASGAPGSDWTSLFDRPSSCRGSTPSGVVPTDRQSRGKLSERTTRCGALRAVFAATTSLSPRSQHRHDNDSTHRIPIEFVWLLGNWGGGGKIFEITTDVMVSSTENYGILRGTILAAAELSDFFPKSLASPITAVAVRPVASVPTKPSSNVRTAKSTPQAANVRRLLFPVKPPPLNLTSNLNQRFFLRGTVAGLPSSHRSRR